MKKFLITFVCLITVNLMFAQSETNPRIERPYGFKAGTLVNTDHLNSTLILKASYFKTHKTEFVAEAGLGSNIYLGINHHFNGLSTKSSFSPYAGFRAGIFNEKAAMNFPVGVNCILRNGFTFSASVVPVWDLPHASLTSYVDFSVGWSFRK